MKQLPSITINKDGQFTLAEVTAKEARLINLIRDMGYGRLLLVIREHQPARYDKAVKSGQFDEEAVYG